MKKQDINNLIQLVGIWLYYNAECIDSTIGEQLDGEGKFTTCFSNSHIEGASYCFQYGIGDQIVYNDKQYRISDIKFAYTNDADGMCPLILKLYLEDA